VLSVAAGLPLGSAFISMVLAERRGGDWTEYLGKGHDWYVMADLIDAQNLNTAATGNFKKRPKFAPYPRPGAEKPKNSKSRARTLAGPGADKASLLLGIFNNLGGAGLRN